MEQTTLKARRARLERFFSAQDLDAILFTSLPNIRYLSSFSGSEGALVVARDLRCWLLCDSRYTAQASAETGATEVRQYTERAELLREMAVTLGLKRVGFEAARMTVADHATLVAKLDCSSLVALDATLDQIRAVKDREEIERLSRVARLASDALKATLGKLGEGISEAAFARELEFEMRRRGADGRAFDFIVASGERGAMPHGRASDRVIRTGELVTVDFGALLDGYHSDETVTVAVGRPDPRAEEIYAIVREAHDRAVAAVRPGMTCRELDGVARDHIRACGYDERFGHGLGHGVGLEIHEKPTISPRGDMVIAEGMVFTIEPGIYIPGFGGVRIEDTVVVEGDGCRTLTQVSKELLYV